MSKLAGKDALLKLLFLSWSIAQHTLSLFLYCSIRMASISARCWHTRLGSIPHPLREDGQRPQCCLVGI